MNLHIKFTKLTAAVEQRILSDSEKNIYMQPKIHLISNGHGRKSHSNDYVPL